MCENVKNSMWDGPKFKGLSLGKYTTHKPKILMLKKGS